MLQYFSTRVAVLFSMYTLEILGRGNQPQGWEIPACAPHPLNKSLLVLGGTLLYIQSSSNMCTPLFLSQFRLLFSLHLSTFPSLPLPVPPALSSLNSRPSRVKLSYSVSGEVAVVILNFYNSCFSIPVHEFKISYNMCWYF